METLKFPILENDPAEQQDEPERAIIEGSPIDELPDAVIEDILSRVSSKTLFLCKLVSKSFLSAITSSPGFSESHFSRSTACPLLVFNDLVGQHPTRILHMLEGRTMPDLENPRLVTRVEFPNLIQCPDSFLPHANTNSVSCEGLVCWASNDGAGDVVICNPATYEFITLGFSDEPKVSNLNRMQFVFTGIGFVRETKTFELLRMVHGKRDSTKLDDETEWWPEVCTVGSKTWRVVEDAEVIVEVDFAWEVQDVVYVNGFIYWRTTEHMSVTCYDFNSRKFRGISLPKFPGLGPQHDLYISMNTRMGALDEVLTVSLPSPINGHVEIWGLKGVYTSVKSWFLIDYLETPTTNFERAGILSPVGRYNTIMYVEEHNILMHDWRDTFLLYDMITDEEINVHLVEEPVRELSRKHFHLQAIPHIPRIIPLRETLNLQSDERTIVFKSYTRFCKVRNKTAEMIGVEVSSSSRR